MYKCPICPFAVLFTTGPMPVTPRCPRCKIPLTLMTEPVSQADEALADAHARHVAGETRYGPNGYFAATGRHI